MSSRHRSVADAVYTAWRHGGRLVSRFMVHGVADSGKEAGVTCTSTDRRGGRNLCSMGAAWWASEVI
eukprot:5766919-Lingulodinium_polyedra.AAC.1